MCHHTSDLINLHSLLEFTCYFKKMGSKFFFEGGVVVYFSYSGWYIIPELWTQYTEGSGCECFLLVVSVSE